METQKKLPPCAKCHGAGHALGRWAVADAQPCGICRGTGIGRLALLQLEAAAPDMLAALEGLRECQTSPGPNGSTILHANFEKLKALTAAIRKARGEG